MSLTWKELAAAINKLPEDRQDDDVTIYHEGSDEYIHVEDILTALDTHDVLDPGAIFLWIPE